PALPTRRSSDLPNYCTSPKPASKNTSPRSSKNLNLKPTAPAIAAFWPPWHTSKTRLPARSHDRTSHEHLHPVPATRTTSPTQPRTSTLGGHQTHHDHHRRRRRHRLGGHFGDHLVYLDYRAVLPRLGQPNSSYQRGNAIGAQLECRPGGYCVRRRRSGYLGCDRRVCKPVGINPGRRCPSH